MNEDDRKIFWKTLCSLEGKNVEGDAEILEEKIKTPKYLYRYRSVNPKSIEALRFNKMYFSTANYYDDPFDTFINVDVRDFQKFFEKILNGETSWEMAEEKLKNILSIMQIPITDNKVSQIISNLKKRILHGNFYDFCLKYLRNIRNEIKKDIWSVCFSENGFNETSWLKYADQHKGFALRYDTQNADNFLCGKQEMCLQCEFAQYKTPLYPIYYSNKKYDATKFAQYITICKTLELFNIIPDQQKLNSLFNSNMIWECERITLIKKECHKYDEEWRMIIPLPHHTKGPIIREWIPDAVIIGLRMENNEKNLIIDIAKQAGIKNIYQSFINDDGELDGDKI